MSTLADRIATGELTLRSRLDRRGGCLGSSATRTRSCSSGVVFFAVANEGRRCSSGI